MANNLSHNLEDSFKPFLGEHIPCMRLLQSEAVSRGNFLLHGLSLGWPVRRNASIVLCWFQQNDGDEALWQLCFSQVEPPVGHSSLERSLTPTSSWHHEGLLPRPQSFFSVHLIISVLVHTLLMQIICSWRPCLQVYEV